MGQSSLLLVVLATLTVGLVTYATQQTNAGSTRSISISQADDFSREAARMGLEQAVRRLVNDPLSWSDKAAYSIPTTTYGAARYRVRLADYRHTHSPSNPAPAVEAAGMVLDDTVTVESIGTYVDPRTGDEREHVIKATYVKGVTDVGIPLPSRMAFASDQELRINGANQVLQGDLNYPANIHANTSLNVQGSPVNLRVEGTGSYNDNVQGDPSIYFYPPTNPDGSTPPKVANVERVPFVETDFSDLSRFSDAEAHTTPATNVGGVPTEVTSSDLTINLESAGWKQNLAGVTVTGAGTATDPLKWFINGNWNHTGSLRFHANGTNAFGKDNQAHIEIYVNGNVSIGGNGTLTPTYESAPPESWPEGDVRTWIQEHLPDGVSLWIYANGDVTMNGTISVAGRLKANGSVTFNGGGSGVNLIGGAEASGDLRTMGGVKVYSTLPASSGTEPSMNYDVPQGVHLIAYVEWMETDEPDPADAP